MNKHDTGNLNQRRGFGLCIKAVFLAMVVSVSAIAGYAAIRNPITVIASTQTTGKVSTGVTNLRIRSSTDTSSTSNVITKVDAGFQLDILDTVNTSDTYAWYYVGFYLNGTYTTGYVTSQYVTLDTTTDYTEDEDFAAYLDEQGFPDSYKEQLTALHEKYPNWVFVADQTGKDWSEVVENENVLGRSLISTSSISSWKSTSSEAYDWETSEWYELDSGGWVQASSALVQYALDPRNFLNEVNIFMFEDLSYNSSIQTEQGVTNIISGTFMASSSDDLTYNGTSYTYASGLMLAGKMSGVSPYHLATRIIQEQGTTGQSGSISGTYSGYVGYYNYYNQGAYKTSTASAIQNGLIYASATDSATLRPWNTRMKSLIGGAIFLGSKYITKGQNTLYYEKFDLVSPYWHQYMTNILAARSESQTQSDAYSTTTKQNTAFVFTIPVYENMPSSACAIPTTDGSPNNKLSSLEISGYSLTPSFSMDTTSYDLIVDNSVSSVQINADAADSTASVSGAGKVSLSVGTNVQTITVTAENGDVRTYTLNIVRKAGSSGSTTDSGSTSGSTQAGYTTDYLLDDTTKTMSKIGIGSSASDVLNGIQFTGGAYGKILNEDGTENSGTVGTGNRLVIYNASGSQIAEYTIVVYGDISGDGVVDVLDIVKIKRYLLGQDTLENGRNLSADANRDGTVDLLDIVAIKRNILGTKYITQ